MFRGQGGRLGFTIERDGFVSDVLDYAVINGLQPGCRIVLVCLSVCVYVTICLSVCLCVYHNMSVRLTRLCISVCTICLSVCVYVCMCLTTHTIYSTAQLHIISCNVSVVATWLMMACYLINLYYHYYISGLQGEDTA